MPILSPCALFGASPIVLTMGRACCLADRPPLGIYDPDPATALSASLFLGLSARQSPEQLDPPEDRLRVALVGSLEGLDATKRLPPRGEQPLLIITFFRDGAPQEADRCQALLEDDSLLGATAITATVPPLAFRLSGPEAARREASSFLRAVSPAFVIF